MAKRSLKGYREFLGWSKWRLPTVMPLVLTGLWGLTYYATTGIRGQIKRNDDLLRTAISAGDAKPIKALGTDGSVILMDGTQYPGGSARVLAEVLGYNETAYYIPKAMTVALPIAWVDILADLAIPAALLLLSSCVYVSHRVRARAVVEDVSSFEIIRRFFRRVPMYLGYHYRLKGSARYKYVEDRKVPIDNSYWVIKKKYVPPVLSIAWGVNFILAVSSILLCLLPAV